VLAEIPGPDRTPIRIRQPRPEDAAAVLAYLRDVGAESDYLTFGSEGPPITESEEREFFERIAHIDNAFAALAEWQGRIVGLITFKGGNRRRTRHIGEFGISVARDCQGVGLGRRLLALLVDWARSGAIVRKIDLLVRVDNARAIALYESFGFVVEGRKRRDMLIDGEFYDALLMGLPIDPTP
jgi:RimJ/RimL family protein N-acetyltransferase